jgi:catechol 2,3-dioxygenase-like lactoylglutathione lyase family enzyme
MIRGVHHVAISTPNLARALAFYRDLLGFEQLQEFSWPVGTEIIDSVLRLKGCAANQVMLKAGNLCIELFEFSAPTPKPMNPARPVCDHGHTHICLDVVNIDETYQTLVAAGVDFHVPPQDFGSLKSTYGRDPDGNVFELQELLDAHDPFQVL